MKSLSYLSLLFLLASPYPVWANSVFFSTGSEYLTNCEDIEYHKNSPVSDWVRVTNCLGYLNGYVNGVQDTIVDMGLKAYPQNSPVGEEQNKFYKQHAPFCLPSEIKMGQINSLFIAFLKANPPLRQGPASVMLFEALKQAYPCKRS